MRKLLCLYAILCIGLNRPAAQTLAEKYGHVQEDFLNKTYVGANIGTGIPFGEFADVDPSHTTAGYAKTGFTYNFCFRYAFTNSLGITARYFNTTNAFNSQKYQDDMNRLLTPITNNSYMYSSDAWNIQGFMFAPTYIIQYLHYNIELGVGVGKVFSTLPQSTTTVTTPPDSINVYSQDAYQSSNWAVSFDCAFRYRVAKNVIVSAQGDVLVSDQTYKNIYTYLTNNTGSYVIYPATNYLQPFRLVHLTVGIGFELDN
jgi:hypothetical protein